MFYLYKNGDYAAPYTTLADARWALDFYREGWPADEWALGPNPLPIDRQKHYASLARN